MTPTEFRALATTLGLRPAVLAHALRLSPRTVQRIARGELPPSPQTAALLRLAAEVPAARAWLAEGAPEDGRGHSRRRPTHPGTWGHP